LLTIINVEPLTAPLTMAQPLHSYTPHGVRSIQGYSTEPKLTAGSRAQIHHGIASNHNPMSVSAHPGGLHQWDIALRNGTGSIMRDTFIKDTEDDMHDAVCIISLFILTITHYIDITGCCP